MPLFQFPIAVTLATCSLLSLALFGLSTSKHGGIALPITSNSPLESRHDPFDVTLPEDIIDGEPIDEEKFWVIVSPIIVVRKCTILPLSFLDEATRCTASDFFYSHRLSPDRHSGICNFVFVLKYQNHMLAPCPVCRLPLAPLGPVCW
jgi:hypothetical protein